MDANDIVQQLQESLLKVSSARDAALAQARDAAQRERLQDFYDAIGNRLEQSQQALQEALATAHQLQQEAARAAKVAPMAAPATTSPAVSADAPIDQSRGFRLRAALVERYLSKSLEARSSGDDESIGRGDWESALEREDDPTERKPEKSARPSPPAKGSERTWDESLGRDDWDAD